MHLLVKTDLRKTAPTWAALTDAYPDLLSRFRDLGVYGTEVAISITGDAAADERALAVLRDWAQPWHDAGLHVYIHPYTSGAGNPSACEAALGGAELDAFKRVVDTAAALADAGRAPVKLTYHAAESGAGEHCEDPRTMRGELLERSIRYFGLAFDYADQSGGKVELATETQLPPRPGDLRVRIGDRPSELLAILAGRPAGLVWDTGHYLLGVERLDLPLQPEAGLVAGTTHMHIHDVVDGVDHRLLRPESHHVANYVAQGAGNGKLTSITLEYDYGQEQKGAAAIDAGRVLAHLEEALVLARSWAAEGGQKAHVS